MFEYRQILTRMRLGDTDRAIARVGLMGRSKAAQLRRTAEEAGWLDVATPLPGDPELSVHLGSVRTQPAVASLAEPHRERITRWWRQGVQGTTIHGALVRNPYERLRTRTSTTSLPSATNAPLGGGFPAPPFRLRGGFTVPP